MANHKSSKKRIRQTEKRRQNNKWKTTRVRSTVKALRAAITEGDKETALGLFPKVQGLIAKLAKSSALKNETASRKISRLSSQVSKL